ncbi:MAG: hypothetical protein HY327_05375 [Chloroflexi bacterium]|nr:hypothetical protein [Chloroflexota bacterium]
MSVSELDKVQQTWIPVTRFLYVPHTKVEYQELVEFLDTLTDIVGEDELHPLASLMEITGVLIEKYEDEHVPEITAV